jgi:hypothetical protein
MTMPPEFECRREIELPATPEQVWDAVATEAGNAAWLFPNEIGAGEGATTAGGSVVTAWDPPHRFGVRTEQGDWFNALEFTIEAREGGRALLRYAHSGIFVDDWDTQYDAVGQHTDFYVHTLSEYLQYFGGRAATYVGDVPGGIQGPPSSAAADSFERLQQALGLRPPVGEGASVRLNPEGLEPIDGVIDYARPNFIGIRTDDALYRLFGRNAFGGPVGISIHVFASGTEPDELKRNWKRWMDAALA